MSQTTKTVPPLSPELEHVYKQWQAERMAIIKRELENEYRSDIPDPLVLVERQGRQG